MSKSNPTAEHIRVLSLIVTLQNDKTGGMTKHQIMTSVKGYRERYEELQTLLNKAKYKPELRQEANKLKEALDKTFTRDKQIIRNDLNIELTSVKDFDNEPVYTITPSKKEFPQFTDEEWAVIFAATEVWNGEQAPLNAGFTREKFMDENPKNADSMPNFPVIHLKNADILDRLVDAIAARQEVSFTYASRTSGKIGKRQVQPLRLVQDNGWYLRARDSSHNYEERWFKLSRIVGQFKEEGEPRTYRIPTDYEPPQLHAEFDMISPVVAISPEAGPILTVTACDTGQIDEATGWPIFELPEKPGLAWAAPLASFGCRLKVLGPDELVTEVVHLLETASHLGNQGRGK